MKSGVLHRMAGRLGRWSLAWAGVIVMGTAVNLKAQEGVELLPIAGINRLLTDPASTVPRPVRFQGNVIFISKAGDFCIQDGQAGVMVEPPPDQPRPQLGDRVECSASVAYRTTDLLDPRFVLPASGVRMIGPGELPDAGLLTLPSALMGEASGRRVLVEGVVMQATVENGVVALHLTDSAGWGVVQVHRWEPNLTTRQWWGARLRVTAANVGRGHSALRVTSSDDITVLTPGTADCFQAPLADFPALLKSGPTPARLRVSGTVLQATSDEIYLRSDAGVPLRSSLLSPFQPTRPQPHPLELLAPRRPEGLKQGDRVELIGSPLRLSPWWQMSYSSIRQLGPAALPLPVEVGSGQNPIPFACDLITLTGRVRWQEGGSGTRLSLDSGGVEVHAILTADEEPSVPWQPGDVIRASGLLLPAEHGRPLTLQVTGALERLSDPPSAWHTLTPLARQWIAGLIVILGAALAGAWWLQRIVRQRTAALAGANEALQAEVAVRVRAEQELARALQQERELSELKTAFVNTVSHEFRTPLGITMSAVELLQHYEDRLPPEQKAELLDDIQRSTRNMAGLMEQVLLLGRAEAGRLSYRPQPVDLEQLARILTDEQLSSTTRKCPIEWTAENDLSGAHADESLLRHIFTNLLSNAVKYSPARAPVHFHARREGNMAVFTVRDHGIGIPDKDLPHLFEAFQRASNVGEIPGTGLGLVISKRCAELHGGTIEVDSTPGEGTTFTVRIQAWE